MSFLIASLFNKLYNLDLQKQSVHPNWITNCTAGAITTAAALLFVLLCPLQIFGETEYVLPSTVSMFMTCLLLNRCL